MANPLTVLFVTDPLCSWCWGMADAIETIRTRMAGEFEFDLVLGGINTDSTQPVGAYGRRLMRRLWLEVAATTGQVFGDLPLAAYVHNSVPVCLALEHLRVARSTPPFSALRELQRCFFTSGENTTATDFLLDFLRREGVVLDRFDVLTGDAALHKRLRFQFSMAKSFGTEAMPSVLIRRGTDTRLVAGGYLDAPMLEEVIRMAATGLS
ncbi:MAG: hypothetical protein FJ194_12925 [Gammaproteobacteria bacterium]|nr:hypothetical protein [Gammaproteobacteria bacterium]